MKKRIPTLGLFCILISAPSFAETGYTLDPKLSNVTFATIKKQFVVEPASIKPLSGGLTKDGQFSILLDLKTVSTGVSIRDQRLNELYFESMTFPEVKISGKVDPSMLSGNPKNTTIETEVTLHGVTKTIDFPVMVVPSEGFVMVNSTSTIIVNGADFGISAENLNKLSATVGGLAISDKVPLNFSLLFDR
ncbi:YceI family protein [Vibrio kanaloae]|uniref:YceI family protein n=1 Tax=Vibrio kanaloae TaxID=170673 RepID=UPI0010BEB594|nr:YceI family protein [Vibrio kanaloae]TKF80089.1 YceI family protein [Vibrio kanaloae]